MTRYFLPPETELLPVYTDKALCIAALKKHKGARFNTFSSYDDALQFSVKGPEVPQNASVHDATAGSRSWENALSWYLRRYVINMSLNLKICELVCILLSQSYNIHCKFTSLLKSVSYNCYSCYCCYFSID